MEKKLGGAWVIITSLFGLIPLVSAYSFGYGIQDGVTRVTGYIEQIGTPVFEVLLKTHSGEFFFSKILIFLLLYLLIFTILKKANFLGDNKGLIALISVIISLLSVRYIPDDDFFNAMLLPYGTLGISLIIFLPFLIYFFFVHTSVPGKFGRRAAWAVYALVFFVLWAFRANEIGAANSLYVAGIGMVVLAFIFDSSIHEYLGLYELGKTMSRISDTQRTDLLRRFIDARDIFNQTGDPGAKRTMIRLAKQLKISTKEEFSHGGGI